MSSDRVVVAVTAQMLAGVIGLLMPPLVDQVNRGVLEHWPSWAKLLVSLASSLVLGTVTALATGEADTAGGWWGTVAAVFVASQVAYRTWWQRAKPAGQGDTGGHD